MCYESKIAAKEARKQLDDTLKDWNPPGIKLEDLICLYYHTSCYTRRGHQDCRSSDFSMKTERKKEREAVKKVITNVAVEN